MLPFACAPGPIELLNGGCGLLVEAENIEDLGEGICTLIENPHIRNAYVTNSLDKVKRYSPESIMRHWVSNIHN